MNECFNKEEIDGIVSGVLEDYKRDLVINTDNIFNKPDKNEVNSLVDKLLQVVYPGFFRDKKYKVYNADTFYSILIEDIMYHLNKEIYLALGFKKGFVEKNETERACRSMTLTKKFFAKLSRIRECVESDVIAAFNGDPAAESYEEIILSYPGLMASTVSRIAHELYLLNVPVLPRLMTEYAHSLTGIDIHPGAEIGKYFFIDHGTGVVIGETTVIGEHVTLYQGVTLGALSTRNAQSICGTKRHPTIHDNVTIYSGASVLGGETIIGENVVIGGNAFITSSVPANTRVSLKAPELEFRNGSHRKSDSKMPDEWFYTI